MRSERVACLVTALLIAAAAALPLPGRAQPAEDFPTRAQVEEAAAQVRQDPNLPGKEKKRTLKFKEDEPRQKDDTSTPDWLKDFAAWMGELARWIDATGRLVVWALGAVLVALLLVGLHHWVKVRGEVRGVRGPRLPSHVGDLDIRPETLPDRIGDAARALWQQGETRAALSLLYRGALSRLVHEHAVPIRAASTEGDCLRLARRQLPEVPLQFTEQLIGAWQLAVYGARLPETEQVLALCAAFDARLSVPPKAVTA